MSYSFCPIFLVDNNEMYSKALGEYLKGNLDFNFRLYPFFTGEDCLQHMSIKPRIIILDYILDLAGGNGDNGLEILKKIKIIDSDAEVIMLSSQGNMSVAVSAMKLGAFDYIMKNERSFVRIEKAIQGIINRLIQTPKESLGRLSA
jgi:two-component system response regulator AtoC